MKEVQTYSTAEDRLYTDVRTIIEEARLNAIRSVDFSRVVMCWKTGRRVFEEEQNGADRADYGTYLIERLASRLEPSFKKRSHFLCPEQIMVKFPYWEKKKIASN